MRGDCSVATSLTATECTAVSPTLVSGYTWLGAQPVLCQASGTTRRRVNRWHGMVTCMLADSGLPTLLWEELMFTVAFLGNNAPHSAIGMQSRYKMLHRPESDLVFFKSSAPGPSYTSRRASGNSNSRQLKALLFAQWVWWDHVVCISTSRTNTGSIRPAPACFFWGCCGRKQNLLFEVLDAGQLIYRSTVTFRGDKRLAVCPFSPTNQPQNIRPTENSNNYCDLGFPAWTWVSVAAERQTKIEFANAGITRFSQPQFLFGAAVLPPS